MAVYESSTLLIKCSDMSKKPGSSSSTRRRGQTSLGHSESVGGLGAQCSLAARTRRHPPERSSQLSVSTIAKAGAFGFRDGKVDKDRKNGDIMCFFCAGLTCSAPENWLLSW